LNSCEIKVTTLLIDIREVKMFVHPRRNGAWGWRFEVSARVVAQVCSQQPSHILAVAPPVDCRSSECLSFSYVKLSRQLHLQNWRAIVCGALLWGIKTAFIMKMKFSLTQFNKIHPVMSSEKIFKTTLNTLFYLNATCFGLDIDHHKDKQMRSLKGR
jgi:hypothetical protein